MLKLCFCIKQRRKRKLHTSCDLDDEMLQISILGSLWAPFVRLCRRAVAVQWGSLKLCDVWWSCEWIWVREIWIASPKQRKRFQWLYIWRWTWLNMIFAIWIIVSRLTALRKRWKYFILIILLCRQFSNNGMNVSHGITPSLKKPFI